MEKKIIDNYNRQLDYLRISVTDLCNLRCRYCMPKSGVVALEHKDILRYEEIIRFVTIVAKIGFSKIRLTGGEPLIRRGLPFLIKELKNIPQIKNVRLTTNGILLPQLAPQLKEAGLDAINISLDTLDENVYQKLTGSNNFKQAWAGLMKALELDFLKIKINCVPILGINDDQLVGLAQLALKYPLEVRFIEFMPIGIRDFWSPDKFISSWEVLNKISKFLPPLTLLSSENTEGPATRYAISGSLGTIGFISALSHSFCDRCNRLRLTADGKIKPCLLSDEELDLKSLLRNPKISDEEILFLIKEAAKLKPQKHNSLKENINIKTREMSHIGG